MWKEQPGALPKHRRPPEEAGSDKFSLEKDTIDDDKSPNSLIKSSGGRRSILGWSRPVVSKAAVSKVAGTKQAVVAEELDEKTTGHVAILSPVSDNTDCPPSATMLQAADAGGGNEATAQLDGNNANGISDITGIASSSLESRPVIPVIHIDKPLPAFPSPLSDIQSPRSVSSPLTSSDSLYSASSKTLPATPDSLDNGRVPFVRRIKSHGDLLQSATPQPSRTVERRGSHQDLHRQGKHNASSASRDNAGAGAYNQGEEDNGVYHDARNDLLVPDAAVQTGPGSTKGNLLKKRSSSLGLGRRPSAASNETIKPSNVTLSDVDASQTGRNVSTATAPPSTTVFSASRDLERKRKPSVFSGIFGGLWKSKARGLAPTTPEASVDEAPVGTSVAGSSSASSENLPQVSAQPRKRASSSASTDSSVIDHGLDVCAEGNAHETIAQDPSDAQTSAASQPPPAAQHRRYSIIHSLFRSVPSSRSVETTQDADNQTSLSDDDLRKPAAPESQVNAQQQPIDIPGSTLPQLPSISRDLGDISFGSLFDMGERRTRGRSRASTRGSLQSLFSSSPRAPSPQGQRSPPASPVVENARSRSRSNSQLQQSFTASDTASVLGLTTGDGGIHGQPERREDQRSLPDIERPRSPMVDKLLQEERRHRTRPFRSNSASSMTAQVSSTSLSDWSKPDIVRSRPAYGRSRSSSTVSASTATRILPSLPEGTVPSQDNFKKPHSPAIMVTNHPQASYMHADTLDPLGRAGSPADFFFDPLGRSSRSSSISTSTDGASPNIAQNGFLSSPRFTTEPDANLADAISDFVLAPPSSPAMRVTEDSYKSGRSSLSAASSVLSSSPASSSMSGQGSRASSIMQKTLRKRANTMGPALSSSLPPSTSHALGNPTISSCLDITDTHTRTGRSNSSSRLSAFFGSSATSLSSSPTESHSVWLTTREVVPDISAGPHVPNPRRSIVRRLSSSLLGSPKISAEDSWSSASSPRWPATTLSVPSECGSEAAIESGDPPAPNESAGGLARNRSHSQLSLQANMRVQLLPDDTPVSFLARVKRLAGPEDIAALLSAKADSFHRTALKLYLAEHDFVNDAIDIAVRKLLLQVHLPKETQQIDRTMEAFAERYHTCNPALFPSHDQPYILAFSIIMLHTDAFNKSNKNKMSRADYVKNTKVEGITPIVLEYIYDNVVYAPFVYADDLAEPSGHGKAAEGTQAGTSLITSTQRERNKTEIYKLITTSQLARFRVDMSLLVPIKNPFSYTGTVSFFDCTALHNALAYAHTVQLPSLIANNIPVPDASASSNASVIRVVRVGILERKDDLTVAGKKASSRKWKSWGVILTEGHLMLFKDASVARNLQDQILDSAGNLGLPQRSSESAHVTWRAEFKPDEMLPLNHMIGLYDFTYTRYANVFRCILPSGRQLLLRASDENSMNLWISTINYAATFRSAGIRLRMPQGADQKGPRNETLPEMPERWPMPSTKASAATTISAGSTLAGIDDHAVGDLALYSKEQNHRDSLDSLIFARSGLSNLQAPLVANGRDHWHTSRGDIIRSRILDLESSILAEQRDLADDIREVRNIAILTPFGAATRHRIEQTAYSVAGKVRRTRQNIAQLICYRECLCRELLAMERQAQQVRHRICEASESSGNRPHVWHSDADLDQTQANQVSPTDGTPHSPRMHRSASQDEISRLIRSPSLLKRSLTSQMQQAYETVSSEVAHTVAEQKTPSQTVLTSAGDNSKAA